MHIKTMFWNYNFHMNYININVNGVDQNRTATLNENMQIILVRKFTQQLGCKCFFFHYLLTSHDDEIEFSH